MISTAFEYSRATSIDDALAKIRATNGEGKFIAGGHSLVPMMKLRLATPEHLVDLHGVGALKGIRRDGNLIVIGAMTTQHELLASDEIAKSLPILGETALLIADPQVRYMGTIGGNVANGDPGNDMPALMLTLGASYRLEGPVIKHLHGHNIVSDGTVNGSVQVPGAGQVIVLMADRQTTGGYPKIATVVSVDLPRLGQCRPGDVIRFAAVSTEEAEARTGRRLRSFNFGVGGITVSSTAAIARILAEDYHPWLIIYGLTARDFSTTLPHCYADIRESQGWSIVHTITRHGNCTTVTLQTLNNA